MSRSYKRTPYLRIEKKDTFQENRWLRHNKTTYIPNGSTFKRLKTTGWDCRYIWTKEQAVQDYWMQPWIHRRYDTLEKWLDNWEKCALRK